MNPTPIQKELTWELIHQGPEQEELTWELIHQGPKQEELTLEVSPWRRVMDYHNLN